jgi:hypothetical protein
LCAADEELPERGRGPDLQEEQRPPARDSARPGALPHHARQVTAIHAQLLPPFLLIASFKKALSIPGFYWGDFFTYNIQHCFICFIEPRTDATGALAVGRSKLASNKKIKPKL